MESLKQNSKTKTTIQVSTELKSILDTKKLYSAQSYEDVLRGLASINTLIQTQPTSSPSSFVVGAGQGNDYYSGYTHILNWIRDTQKKMPAGGEYDTTPEMREHAYRIDSLLSGIIVPYLKNVILGSGSTQTADNKKFSACIKDIDAFLEEIALLKIFREDFEDYAVKHGHSYRRKDYYPDNEELKRLQRLEPKAMHTYEDPWDSSITAYQQKIYINETWQTTTAVNLKETNSWFIPDGIKYIPEEGIEPDGAKELWELYKQKYHISEVNGLRVDSADNVIAMHKVKPKDPAPIDPAILPIWLKTLILANGPNYILSVIMPFLHLKKGIILKVPDGNGGERLITSVPPKPPAGMETTDPERYAALNADYTAYVNAAKEDGKNLYRYRAEGGVFISGPDNELVVTESGRNITAGFIQTMINLLDETIARSVGFPLSLITASGTELATSRTILELFNAVYVGDRQEYEFVANALIKERFEGETWDYEITLKDGTTEIGTYTFEEAQPKWQLQTGDVKDALKIAQTKYTTMQSAQIAKAIGASQTDIQAFLDENGFGIWDLDRFGETTVPATAGQGMFATKSSATEFNPENMKNQDELLGEELRAMYEEARKGIGKLFGEP